MTVHELIKWLGRSPGDAEVTVSVSYVDNVTGERTHADRRIVGLSGVDEHPVIEVGL